jgi:hypothetical protein
MSNEQIVRSLLQRVRRRWRALVSLRAGAAAGLGASLVMLAWLAADWLLAPAGTPLVLLAAVSIVSAAGLAVWLLRPVRENPTDRQVARYVEERCAEFEDRLVSMADLLDREPTGFQDLVLAQTARCAGSLQADDIVPSADLRAGAWKLAGAATLLLIVAALAIVPVGRAVRTASMLLNPERLEFEIVPGDARVVAGEPLRIIARLRGTAALTDRDEAVLIVRANGEDRQFSMQEAEAGFTHEIPAVDADFTYRVAIGHAISREYEVTALRPPRVTRIDVHYRYPGFTGLPPREEEDGGDIYAPAGTAIRLRVQTDKPVASGAMVLGEGDPLSFTPQEPDLLEADFTVAQDGSYRVALVDPDGLRNAGDTEYFIRVMDDRPPDVRIVRPGGDREVTPLQEVLIEARADDDYGIERLEIVYSVRGTEERVVSLPGPPDATTRTGSHVLYLEDLDVQPGDFVTYYARARDVGRGKRSTESRSDIFFLEVKPFEAEFVSAQSSAMMGGGGDQAVDDLANAQKEIIIATWKVERRAMGGRSEQDIRAIARAQGELKARAQEVASRLAGPATPPRRRSREPRPEVAQVAEAESPMRLAVEAMGQAQTALEATRTSDALPHEMEALNQLLKAQAEIRRWQVNRQQASAGGGAQGRPRQDLSSLFDRELQRQQQTHYETPSSSQPQDEATPESEALKKVRELAKRQDHLSREQRELAKRQAELSTEELKRQLERLTREQSELRREAEELAKQMARQQSRQSASAGTEGEAGESQGSRGERMRDISEEMRGAASDLRREDVDQASSRGERALEKLRGLEQQLRGAQPDERRRALGELQMEAQMLAEAQQRAAAEAKRVDAGEGSTDALRRMAGEKERLADRVEQLERGIRQLAAGADDTQRPPLAEASRELEQQAVGRRMRETASRMRAAADPQREQRDGPTVPRLAESEQQIARSLETVVRRLGAAGGDRDRESGQLSDQLARMQELRDRLGEIERRLDQLARSGEKQAGGEPGSGTDSQSDGQLQEQQPAQGGRESGQQAFGDGQSAGSDGRSGGEGGELARLRAEYDRELREAERLMREMQGSGVGGGYLPTPETHQYTASAPGTEAFKQDFSRWDVLRRGVNDSLDRLEATVAAKLYEQALQDRLAAGDDQRMPEEYRKLVEQYYRSLARKDDR